jgi:cytochrome b561
VDTDALGGFPHDELLSAAGELAHQWVAYILDVLLAGHIAAVIWHQWIKKDSVLARMMPPWWPVRSGREL